MDILTINNSVYINNARDNNGNHNGAVEYNIRFKVIITGSYKWNNVGNVISSESYGSIDRHKDISFNASTLLHKVLVINMIRILFNITILLMLILFIYSLKLFKLIT